MTSNGFSNSHGHPRKVAINKVTGFLDEETSHRIKWCTGQSSCRFKNLTTDFLSTATSGTIIVGSDGDSYWIAQRHEHEIE